MRIVIYQNETGGVGMLVPYELPAEEVGLKDVPAGVPFLIVEREQLPESLQFFDAWEADFSQSDGHGIGEEAWLAAEEAKANLLARKLFARIEAELAERATKDAELQALLDQQMQEQEEVKRQQTEGEGL